MKELFAKKLLGIHYDKDGNVKAIDIQGMTLAEVISELKKKIKEKEAKNGCKKFGDTE